MKLIVVSAEVSLAKEVEWIRKMIDEGLFCFHLRRKTWDLSRTQRFLEEIGGEYQSRIRVHGPARWQGKLLGAKVHLRDGEEANSEGQSKSFHTLFDANRESMLLEYGFISPIYDSISKPGYRGAFKKEELQRFLADFKKFDLFALGGVTVEKLDDLKSMGFKGAAVMGALWFARDPLVYFNLLKEKCLELSDDT